MAKEHPLFDDYWASKNADLAKITVPAFVVASGVTTACTAAAPSKGSRRFRPRRSGSGSTAARSGWTTTPTWRCRDNSSTGS
jgi:predicted acyl esterase